MRQIDADALEVFVKTVRQGMYLDKTLSDIPIRDSMLLNFQQYVHLQPTIDAVPVVRCGECDRRIKSADLTNTVLCGWLHKITMNKDDFCSYGAKMEDKS